MVRVAQSTLVFVSTTKSDKEYVLKRPLGYFQVENKVEYSSTLELCQFLKSLHI